MFIKKSFVDEIAHSMERQLVDGVINKQAEAEARLVKAADYLNAAAEIFDESGMTAQAELVTVLLESLAAKKSKKKKVKPKAKKKPVSKKEMTSERMVKNLEEKGWMFDESDANDSNYAADHNHASDENCAACGDVSYAEDDKEEELYSMLQNFKDKADLDFEDEDDDFELEIGDPLMGTRPIYVDRE